eukprot:scaffold194146_cov21-Tisochrysis_lutea.AAC.1
MDSAAAAAAFAAGGIEEEQDLPDTRHQQHRISHVLRVPAAAQEPEPHPAQYQGSSGSCIRPVPEPQGQQARGAGRINLSMGEAYMHKRTCARVNLPLPPQTPTHSHTYIRTHPPTQIHMHTRARMDSLGHTCKDVARLRTNVLCLNCQAGSKRRGQWYRPARSQPHGIGHSCCYWFFRQKVNQL